MTLSIWLGIALAVLFCACVLVLYAVGAYIYHCGWMAGFDNCSKIHKDKRKLWKEI